MKLQCFQEVVSCFHNAGVHIFLDLPNVGEDEEEKMSVVLEQLFDEVIKEDNNFKSSIPTDSYASLRKAVKKTFQLFLSKGWRIASVKQECIKLYIKCDSFKSLAALFREHINGQINEELAYLKDSLSESFGYEIELETTIYKDEFWNALEKSSKKKFE